MYSVVVQEITFDLAGGTRIDCYVEEHGGLFGAECVFPMQGLGGTRTLSRMPAPARTARDAFEWVADECWKFVQASGATVRTVDNPCNEPFVTRQEQRVVLAAYGVPAPVLLNGAP